MHHQRILALDVGDARVGVALSDPLGISAQPLCTIEQKGAQTFSKILDLVREHAVATIVVGFPYELDGSIGEQARQVERFCARLRQAVADAALADGVRIEPFDERFTTQQAERTLVGSKLKNKERSAAIDRVAAALILEGYLLRIAGRGSSF
ncbi:MAG: Holliday junction resolvase RuvX [Bdellovibrionales bacterium]|nr:Holliday junction resolvase RuvX [Bdellovibrionales bacterium]